jgi:hypothetical protein
MKILTIRPHLIRFIPSNERISNYLTRAIAFTHSETSSIIDAHSPLFERQQAEDLERTKNVS